MVSNGAFLEKIISSLCFVEPGSSSPKFTLCLPEWFLECHFLFFPPFNSLQKLRLLPSCALVAISSFPQTRVLWSPFHFWNVPSETKVTEIWLNPVVSMKRHMDIVLDDLESLVRCVAWSACWRDFFSWCYQIPVWSYFPVQMSFWVGNEYGTRNWFLISPVVWMLSPRFLSHTFLWILIFHIVLILWNLNELSDAFYQHELETAYKVPLTDLLHFIMSLKHRKRQG